MRSSPLAMFPFQYHSWNGIGCFSCPVPLSGPCSQGWPSLTPWEDPASSSSGPAHDFTLLHRQIKDKKPQPNSIHVLQQWENRLRPCTARSRDFSGLQKTTRKIGEVPDNWKNLESSGFWAKNQKEDGLTLPPKYSFFLSCANLQSATHTTLACI